MTVNEPAQNKATYPLIVYTEDYVSVAYEDTDLMTHPFGRFRETEHQTRNGDLRVLDSNGTCFNVIGWTKILRPAGLKWLVRSTIGSTFASPVLEVHKKFSFDEFREIVSRSILASVADTEPELLRSCSELISKTCFRSIIFYVGSLHL